MLIVDSQIHIYEAGTPTAHHLRGLIPHPFTKDDLLAQMQSAGVDRAILVGPGWDPNGDAYSLEAARQHPDRFAVMGWVDYEQPESRDLIAGWKQQPGMLGLRLSFNTSEALAQLRDGKADWLWAAAEKHDIPVMLLTPGALSEVVRIAQAHPGLKLIADHLGIPRGLQGAAAFAHMPDLLALARFPNVAVKAGGIPGYAEKEPYPFTTLHQYLRQVFDAFGPSRVHWASDLTRVSQPYRKVVTMFTEELPWLRGKDLELVMGRGVCEWVGWAL